MTTQRLKSLHERAKALVSSCEKGSCAFVLATDIERVIGDSLKLAEKEELRLDEDLIEMERRHREWEKARV